MTRFVRSFVSEIVAIVVGYIVMTILMIAGRTAVMAVRTFAHK